MKEIVEFLIENNKTIATMESCTGGLLAEQITSIEGASKVLKYSAITYSNEFKIKMGVDKNIIDKYSVYSEETAKEMSQKISNYTNSDYGVGITGKLNRVDEKNLFGNDNEVFISIYDKEKDTFYTTSLFVNGKTREESRMQVIETFIKTFNKEII